MTLVSFGFGNPWSAVVIGTLSTTTNIFQWRSADNVFIDLEKNDRTKAKARGTV